MVNVEKIIERLVNINESKNRRSYYMLETLILNVINKHIRDQNKEFHTNYGSKFFEIDGYSPSGFDNYNGATAIEIKLFRKKEVILDYSRRTIDIVDKVLRVDEDIKNVIFLFIVDLTEQEKQLFTNHNLRDKVNTFVWDINDLQKIFNNYPEYVLEISENISTLMIESKISESINKDENDWKAKRNEHLINLKKCYYDDDIVLFLGAGVSIDAKIATWDQLISDLLVTLISSKLKDYDINLTSSEKDFIIEKLKKLNGNAPLLQARYIRTGLEDIFVDVLISVLYKDCINKSDILTEIAQLCLPVRNGIGVKAVVTYNFDDLIEYNFDELRIKYKAIYKEGEISSKNELDVFHVHGFLPRNREKYSDISKGLLVFSEEGYHNLILDPYNWANIIQLNYLRENTCLFIGLSMTDPNLRRLLDIAARKQELGSSCKHYAILKRMVFSSGKNDTNEINMSNIKRFDIVNSDLQEEFFKELGINIIWVDDFKEIPSILRMIKE